MLLGIDIGNTNIVIGIFNNNNLLEKWRIATDFKKTADEYSALIEWLLTKKDITIDAGIFSSVVPPLDKVFVSLFRENFGVEPLIVSYKLNLGINIKYKNPEEIGADRLVNAAAGVNLYGAPLIIIDFGTATTFCFIDKEKNYCGGLILPGITLMRNALHIGTAKLPEVEFIKPNWIIGDNTVAGLQAGLYYQNVGAINYIIKLLMENYDKNSKIILTGGFASLFRESIDYPTIYEPDLTLKGLNIIYHLNGSGKCL